jgi:hypothetical protein
MTYETIRPSLQTGDIVLFRGKGGISRWIRRWCSLLRGLKPTWASHVGMVIVEREYGRVMLLESTSIRGGIKGVRLVALGDMLADYKGDARVRHLKHELPLLAFDSKASSFARGVLGRPYERSLLELMRSAWSHVRNKSATPESLFCSELVAMAYQALGLLPVSPSANNYTPEDFRLGGVIDKMIRLSPQAACLGEEIEITKGKDEA